MTNLLQKTIGALIVLLFFLGSPFFYAWAYSGDEALLGLKGQYTERDLKRAYRQKAAQYHPDKNLGNEDEATVHFQNIQNAYSRLIEKLQINDQRRRAIDPEDWAQTMADDVAEAAAAHPEPGRRPPKAKALLLGRRSVYFQTMVRTIVSHKDHPFHPDVIDAINGFEPSEYYDPHMITPLDLLGNYGVSDLQARFIVDNILLQADEWALRNLRDHFVPDAIRGRSITRSLYMPRVMAALEISDSHLRYEYLLNTSSGLTHMFLDYVSSENIPTDCFKTLKLAI